MLRVDVDGTPPCGIPADNLFVASGGCGMGAGCPEVFAWGLRNPWRWSFDRNSGDFWVGDVLKEQGQKV
jgi:glucose/arabinose dehydrogenase